VKNGKWKKQLFYYGMLLVLGVVAGCGNGAAPQEPAAGSNADGQEAASGGQSAVEETTSPEAPIKVALLPAGTTSPFHSKVAKGAQVKGEELGLEVIVQAPANESDFNAQVSMMENLIAQKVQAICVNPMDEKAVSAAIEKANAAGIPVFFYPGMTSSAKGEVTSFIGNNQYKVGKAMGEYAAKLLNGEGEVLILNGIPSYYANQRSGGFKDALKDYPGITIVMEQNAEWVRDKAMQITTQALQAHPEIKLAFGASDEMAIGASIAAKNAGKDIFTLGIDGNPVTLEEIKKGNVTATVGTSPDKIGETIAIQMSKALKGEPVPKYLETPTVVVDIDNLEDYQAGKLWTEPVEGEEEVAN